MTEQMKTDINPQQRKRHGCLTAYLIILLWQSCAYLWLFYCISLHNTPLWDVLFFASFAVNIFGIIALFKWKKWGFWMLCIFNTCIVIWGVCPRGIMANDRGSHTIWSAPDRWREQGLEPVRRLRRAK